MSGYKHIERLVAGYIAGRYRSVAEIGAGRNTIAAELLMRAGMQIFCVDLSVPAGINTVPYFRCDIRTPDYPLFSGVECLYAIRPVEEMMMGLIDLASTIHADLYVYHLGFEGYNHPHQIIDCGIPLCKYITRQN